MQPEELHVSSVGTGQETELHSNPISGIRPSELVRLCPIDELICEQKLQWHEMNRHKVTNLLLAYRQAQTMPLRSRSF